MKYRIAGEWRQTLVALIGGMLAVVLGAGSATAAPVPGGVHDYDALRYNYVVPAAVAQSSAANSTLSDARSTSFDDAATDARGHVGDIYDSDRSLVAPQTTRLTNRVDEFHGALDPIAQNSRTTSVMSTREGVHIVSSGGRDLGPAQRALAQEADVLGRLPGAYAEVTALDAAAKAGLNPSQIAVSRPICPACQVAIQNSGGRILPGGSGAVWPR